MRPACIALAALLTITLMTVSCRKIGSETVTTSPLQFEKLVSDNAIPLQFGDLISVTPSPESDWSVLWFMKQDKSIVALYVNSRRGFLARQAVVIPRR